MQSEELTLEAPITINPVYNYLPVIPSIVQPIVVGASNIVIPCKIPAQTVFNPARSFVTFDYTIGAGGGTHYATKHVCKVPFDQIEVVVKGMKLMSLQKADLYSKTVVPFTMDINDYGNRDAFRNAATVATSFGMNTYCQPVKVADPNAALPAAATASVVTGRYVATNGADSGDTLGIAVGALDGPLSRQYVAYGAVNAVSAGKSTMLFSDFTHTFLGLNKNLFFGNNEVQINFTLSVKDRIAYDFVTAADPPTNIGAGQVTTVGAFNISGFQLWLAVEQEPRNIENITNKYNSSGLDVNIPWVSTYSQPLGTALVGAYTQSFTSSDGLSLSRIYNTFTHTTDTLDLTVNTENVNAIKVEQYQTRLGKVDLQKSPVIIANNEDWLLHKEMLEGTALCSSRQHKINWVICDNFSSNRPAKEWRKEDEDISGVKLAGSTLTYYTKVTKTATDLTQNVFAVFHRSFHISNMGVSQSAM